MVMSHTHPATPQNTEESAETVGETAPGVSDPSHSATTPKPHKVRVWVCGNYVGEYAFATAEEADADYEYRKQFRVLGCHYRRESPGATKP